MSKPAVFGMVLFLLLAAQGAPVSAQGGETPPLQAPAGVPDGPAALPPGWQEVMTEDFEGAWPGSGWSVTDVSSDGFERYWGKEGYEPVSATYPDWPGSWSVWPASDGADAVDAAGLHYPDYVNTIMAYGPFDLSDAVDAKVSTWLWLEIENAQVEEYFSISTAAVQGSYSEAISFEGAFDWSEIVVDLTSYLGAPSVWVRWEFSSDDRISLRGAFIDNITISKLPLAAPAVTISRSGSTINLSWAAVPNATGYEVWRGINDPYFTPGTTCPATNCAVVTSPSYPHANPVSTTDNYTYVVRAVKGNVKSLPTNRVSEFDYTLVH